MRLKNKWQSVIWSAYGIALAGLARAASIPVIHVPIFAPRLRGYIRSRLTTPTPTNGVNVDVNTELL